MAVKNCKLSWRRVLLTVAAVMLVITPTVIYVAYSSDVVDTCRVETIFPNSATNSQRVLDFDLFTASIPKDEIRRGGPAKDGIPALSEPSMITASEAEYLEDSDRVIGVVFKDYARAYPLRILNWHEIVNDVVADVPIAITYCPLCDSAAAFDRRTDLGQREFGVSGLLYNSNVLMYDRSSDVESLWSQVLAKGVSGPGSEKQLTALPVELTTWSDWKGRFPETLVLSTDTGHERDYTRNPYAGYFQHERLIFPLDKLDERLPTKERVLGVWSENACLAFPESAFDDERAQVQADIDGKRIVVAFDSGSRTLRVTSSDEGIHWMYSLWFAWAAMHPKTEIYQPIQ